MTNQPTTPHRRRIDHLVLAVHDLEAAADLYRRLGFQVGARNHHAWGTDNHVIQFASSFLELITVADAGLIPEHAPSEFSFGAFVRDYLNQREGLAMFVLDSVDAHADAADFARAGIGDYRPFYFERGGRAADGTPTKVAFTLAFATDDGVPGASFFVCQQHHPESFWSPQFQQHANGALNVASVTLQVPRPADHAEFLSAFTGMQRSTDGRSYPLDRGGRLVVEADAVRGEAAGFVAFSTAVVDVDVVARRLRAEGIAFERSADRVVVTADEAFGVQIEFEATSAS